MVKPFNSLLFLMLSDFDPGCCRREASQVADQSERNVSGSRNIGLSVSQNWATHLTRRHRGALSARHATVNQPKDRPLELEAYLKLYAHQGRASGGHKREKCHGQMHFNCCKQQSVPDRHWKRSSLILFLCCHEKSLSLAFSPPHNLIKFCDIFYCFLLQQPFQSHFIIRLFWVVYVLPGCLCHTDTQSHERKTNTKEIKTNKVFQLLSLEIMVFASVQK